MIRVYNPNGNLVRKQFASVDDAKDWVYTQARIEEELANASSDFLVELITEGGDVWGIKFVV